MAASRTGGEPSGPGPTCEVNAAMAACLAASGVGVEPEQACPFPRHGGVVRREPRPHPDRVGPAVRGDRRDVGGGEPRSAVVRVRVAGPRREVGVGVGEHGPQRRAQRGPAPVEPGVRQPQPVHGDVAEPLRAQRRGQFDAAGPGQVAPGVGVERRVGGLAVRGDHQGDLGACPVQGLQASARAEGLVVGMRGDDGDPAVPGAARTTVDGALQRRRPGPHGCHGPGGRRRCSAHAVRHRSTTWLPSAAWSRSAWCWRT